MRRFIFFLFVACSAIAQNSPIPDVPVVTANSPIPNECKQIIVVLTKGWTNVDGELRCFERSDSKWRRVIWKTPGKTIPVAVGRNGLKWASDAQYRLCKRVNKLDGFILVKREGDGCSPAGVLGLPLAFGYAPTAHWIKLPYIQCTDAIECVDDGKSAHYNQVLDSTKVAKRDWDSSEHMHRKDVLYRWGVVVDHNAERKPGNGSCIFLSHLGRPTQGNDRLHCDGRKRFEARHGVARSKRQTATHPIS